MLKLFYLNTIAFLSFTIIFSQNNNIDYSNVREGENVEYCKTHKVFHKLMKNQDFAQRRALDMLEFAEKEELIEQENLNKSGTVYKIPIVFHVLHNGGTENISRAQILDGLRILNRDFRKQNSDANNVVSNFQGMPADIEIEFVLATIAPNGQCFSGITRTVSPLTVDTETDNISGEDQVNAIKQGNDVYQGTWNPSKYLNIYICKQIGGAAGYTTYPNSFNTGNMVWNGIFVLHNYVGSIGTSSPSTSRTLTHECGHWLNLPHTWGDSNSPGLASNCNIDDGIADTPNTLGVQSCNLSESSCSGILANVENYMDYSYCSKMFTPGQRTRMRAAITSSIAGRSNLWKTANLNSTGANGSPNLCKADFSLDNKVICEGNSVSYIDESYHNPTSWNWTFEGGTPATSSIQNPSVTYNTSGTYSVTLSVTNSSGTVSTTKNQYITVLPETGIPPIQEGFEYTNSIPSDKWFVNNSSSNWELTNTVASSGNNSIMINNSQNAEGIISEIESSTITLDLNTSATISFDYAFAKKVDSNSDRLTVKVSNNCGQNWHTKKVLSGSNLKTAPNTTGNFVPSDNSQWKTATINSSSLSSYLTSDFRIKFIFKSGGGNNIYIDNINIDGPVSIKENSIFNNLSIYPNPAKEKTTINFTSEANFYSIKLLDIIGKEVEVLHNGMLNKGDQNYILNTSNYKAGVYLLNISKGNQREVHKIIIE